MKNLLILLILTTSSFSYASERPRWGVNASPRYYSLYDGRNVTTFGTTGNLGSPKTYAFGVEGIGYVLLGANWQVGVGLGGLGYSDDNGIASAHYNQGYLGLWLGKQFQLSSVTDVQLGSLIGEGFAETELLSTGPSGRTVEKSLLIVPKLTVAFRVTELLKIGASGSYFIPAAYTQSIRGQNLTGNSHITVRGPSAGLEFVFSPQ